MSRTKRFGVAIFGVLLVLAVYIAFKWKASHEEGLQPKLVLTVKASEYPNLTPTEHCFVHGKDVDDICSAHGVSGRPIVAAGGGPSLCSGRKLLIGSILRGMWNLAIPS